MIIEKIYCGKLDSKFHFAEIEVDLYLSQKGKAVKNIRAYIDTGANKSCVNESLLAQYIELEKEKTIEAFSFSGKENTKEISNIYIRLVPLMEEKQFIPLPSVRTCNLVNGFQAIVGNDILYSCEFTYNGLSDTFFLKYYAIRPDQKAI